MLLVPGFSRMHSWMTRIWCHRSSLFEGFPKRHLQVFDGVGVCVCVCVCVFFLVESTQAYLPNKVSKIRWQWLKLICKRFYKVDVPNKVAVETLWNKSVGFEFSGSTFQFPWLKIDDFDFLHMILETCFLNFQALIWFWNFIWKFDLSRSIICKVVFTRVLEIWGLEWLLCSTFWHQFLWNMTI